MTMSVKELPIQGDIETALRTGDNVVEFNDISILEEQVVSLTAALLTFEQLSKSGTNERWICRF